MREAPIVCSKETTQKPIQNEKAENYDPDKGTTTTKTKNKKRKPEKQLSDLDITNLHGKDFRLTIVNMTQDLGNKLEAKIDKLQETLKKEMEDLKIKQPEIQNTITEIKKIHWK